MKLLSKTTISFIDQLNLIISFNLPWLCNCNNHVILYCVSPQQWHCFILPHIEKWIVLHLIIGLYCTDGEIRIQIRNPLERLWLHFWHNLTDPEIIPTGTVQFYTEGYMNVWMCECVWKDTSTYILKKCQWRGWSTYISAATFSDKQSFIRKHYQLCNHIIWYDTNLD